MFAPKNPEYKARLNFIRLMAMSAKHFNMAWHVTGSFIRHVISGNTDIKGTSMTVYLTPVFKQSVNNRTNALIDKVSSMMNELEIMGMKFDSNFTPVVSRGMTGLEPTHVYIAFEAQMLIADAGNITFPVVVKAFDKEESLYNDYLHPFSTDTIVLGANSMHIMKKSNILDKMNQYAGISLLERIVKIQDEKSIVQFNGFSTSTTWTGTVTNSTLMHSLKQLKKEGFNVIGNTIETSSTCSEGLCPICLEVNETFVPLQCSHAFCLTCLANHLVSGANGLECPMCRSQIVPCTKVSM
jgi:hypothetical protein